MIIRIATIVTALSFAAPAHGASPDATPPAGACPRATAEAPPVLTSGAPTPADDFKLVYSCALATPSV